jgi:hypothetical protein
MTQIEFLQEIDSRILGSVLTGGRKTIAASLEYNWRTGKVVLLSPTRRLTFHLVSNYVVMGINKWTYAETLQIIEHTPGFKVK